MCLIKEKLFSSSGDNYHCDSTKRDQGLSVTTVSCQNFHPSQMQAAGAFDGYGEECDGKDVCIGPIIKVCQ